MTTTINADTTNGVKITSDTSGVMGLQTNGNTAVTIDGSQNVGIGTTTPDIFSRGYGRTVGINDSGSSGAVLQINSASSYSALELGRGGVRKAFFTAQSTVTELGNLEAVPLAFYTNSAERARIDSSGNLGIGTTSPDAKLDVTSIGTASAYTVTAVIQDAQYPASGNPTLEFNGFIGGNGYRSGIGSIGGQQLAFYTPSTFGVAPTERARIDSSGRWLVGLTSSLNAAGAIQAGGFADTRVIIDSTSTSGIYFTKSGADNGTWRVSSGGNYEWYVKGSGTPNMVLDSSGNLGIGANISGSYKLEVNGNIVARRTTDNNPHFFSMSNSSSICFLESINGLAASYLPINFKQTHTGTSQTSMVLDASGNLGVGVTSVTTSGSRRVLQLSNSTNGGMLMLNNSATQDNNPRIFGSVSSVYDLGLAAGSSTGFINFYTNGIDRGRFSAAGDLELYVTAAKDGQLRWTGGGGGALQGLIYCNGNPEVIVQSGGTGGVKLTSGATSWVSASDTRFKNIIEPIANAVDKVNTLSAVIYSFKDDETAERRVGLISQELLAVLPEAVHVPKKEEEMMGVRYTETIPLLVAAIKEQSALITQLQADVAALKGA